LSGPKFSDTCNVTVWRPSVHLSVSLSHLSLKSAPRILKVTPHGAARDAAEYYEDVGYILISCWIIVCV